MNTQKEVEVIGYVIKPDTHSWQVCRVIVNQKGERVTQAEAWFRNPEQAATELMRRLTRNGLSGAELSEHQIELVNKAIDDALKTVVDAVERIHG